MIVIPPSMYFRFRMYSSLNLVFARELQCVADRKAGESFFILVSGGLQRYWPPNLLPNP